MFGCRKSKVLLVDIVSLVIAQICTPRTNLNTSRYSYSSASCLVYIANVCPWTNTLPQSISKPWSEYSSHRRIPSHEHGEYSVRGQKPVQTRDGEYSVRGIPSQKRGASVRGRLHSRKYEANIHPWMNTLSKTSGEYCVVGACDFVDVTIISNHHVTAGNSSGVVSCRYSTTRRLPARIRSGVGSSPFFFSRNNLQPTTCRCSRDILYFTLHILYFTLHLSSYNNFKV